METQELHRGRLIDHIQLVVRDLSASQTFYAAIFDVLKIPMGGTGDGFFWADELFVSTRDSKAAQGALTGRHHLAFQAQNRAMVDAFYKSALANRGKDNGAPGERATIQATTPLSSWIRTATISKLFTMVQPTAARPPCTSRFDRTDTPCIPRE